MNIIIFSKDRPAQCDLTLTSLFNNCCYESEFPRVLYTFSNEKFEQGYNKLVEKWSDKVDFIQQTIFKDNVVELCDSIQSYTVFFTDDDIFYRKIDYGDRQTIDSCLKDRNVCTFSLRLGDNITIQDYHRNIPMIRPNISYIDGICIWKWREAFSESNYGYPLSVDGHIFRTEDIQCLVGNFEYDNPNSFEGRVQQYNNSLPPLMCSFIKSCIVNTPINRVQETCTNLAGQQYGIPSDYMNDLWLEGFEIDLNKIRFDNIYGCHQELPISLVKKV